MRPARPLLTVAAAAALAGCAPQLELSVIRLRRHPVDASALQWQGRRAIGLPRVPATNYFTPLEERCGAPPPWAASFTDYMRTPDRVAGHSPEEELPAWALRPGDQLERGQRIAGWASGAGCAGIPPAAPARTTLIRARPPAGAAAGTCADAGCTTVQLAAPAKACKEPTVAVVTADGQRWLSGVAGVDSDLGRVFLDGGVAGAGVGAPVTVTCDAALGAPLLAFFHLTDIQLRDAKVKLGDEAQSVGLDRVIDSFEHDFEQELFIDLVFEAVVGTMNETQRLARADNGGAGVRWLERAPAFAIHTGDAVDAGTWTEMAMFHDILDHLEVTWLSVIGNHDVLTFGNLLPGAPTSIRGLVVEFEDQVPWYLGPLVWLAGRGHVTVPDPVVRCAPPPRNTAAGACDDQLLASSDGGVARFIAAHRHPRSHAPAVPAPPLPYQASGNHGFDLNGDRGYYRFELPAVSAAPGGRSFRIVNLVLNTSDFSDAPAKLRGGAAGFVSAAQVTWLQRELAATTTDDLVLLYAHHPLRTIGAAGRRAAVEAALLEASRAKGNIVAYVTGHTHAHSLRFHSAARGEAGKGRGFWEFETAAIIGFPQEQHLVTLKQLDDRVGFIELVPFSHTVDLAGGSELATLLARADRGARRDHCRKSGRRCIAGEPVRSDGDAAFARLFFYLPEPPPPAEAP